MDIAALLCFALAIRILASQIDDFVEEYRRGQIIKEQLRYHLQVAVPRGPYLLTDGTR